MARRNAPTPIPEPTIYKSTPRAYFPPPHRPGGSAWTPREAVSEALSDAPDLTHDAALPRPTVTAVRDALSRAAVPVVEDPAPLVEAPLVEDPAPLVEDDPLAVTAAALSRHATFAAHYRGPRSRAALRVRVLDLDAANSTAHTVARVLSGTVRDDPAAPGRCRVVARGPALTSALLALAPLLTPTGRAHLAQTIAVVEAHNVEHAARATSDPP